MSAYVALLRGVNVGGRAKIAMADLRSVLAGLGYGDVRTLLQSGNAVFTAAAKPAAVAAAVESALETELGLTTRCLIRTGDELRAVIAAHPFAEVADNGSRMVAAFLSELPAAAVRAEHDPVALDPERIRLGDRVIYQWCPDGISEAPLMGPYVERKWKVVVTARNWNTVTKLADMAGPG
ncbi:DUF1697 domain-containing protein [Actinokineospora sp. NBRC 105648]|uniref:DUF1697 domain-containing protein n=1 Tax=Actinokineospora sp. NBRC 105648 TaxID=3032206 RepID=UPI0024A3FCA9|nr:DUF1697 domain-containing protein [Actinokineospora sp. NBRC 105648]GLZ41279.1 hypothetical protein Acsp05_49030 [Actinokineospora sp. NBRC 105648]